MVIHPCMPQKQEVGLAADAPADYVPSVSSNLMSEVTDRGIKCLFVVLWDKTTWFIRWKKTRQVSLSLTAVTLSPVKMWFSCGISDSPSCPTSKLAGTMPLGVFNKSVLANCSGLEAATLTASFFATFERKTFVGRLPVGVTLKTIIAAATYVKRWLEWV